MAISPVPDVTAFRKLWAAWEPLSEEEQEKVDKAELDLGKLTVDEAEEPSLAVRVHNLERFDLYRDIVNLYASDCEEADKDRFKKLRRELDAPAMRQFDQALRIKRATEGKDAANKKYKDGNWFGALYTYTVAWGCLVPYYPAAVTDAKIKADYIKLEYQLFSNIAAMVVSGLTAKKDLKKAEQRRTLMEIGLRACLLIRGMADSVTAGVMNKTCRRATDIHMEYLAKFSSPAPASVLTSADLEWFAKQGPVLDKLDKATQDKLYKDLPNASKVRMPTAGAVAA